MRDLRPAHHDEEWPPLATTGESPRTETKTQHSQKINIQINFLKKFPFKMRWKHFQIFLYGEVTDALTSGLINIGGGPFWLCHSLSALVSLSPPLLGPSCLLAGQPSRSSTPSATTFLKHCKLLKTQVDVKCQNICCHNCRSSDRWALNLVELFLSLDWLKVEIIPFFSKGKSSLFSQNCRPVEVAGQPIETWSSFPQKMAGLGLCPT